MFKPFACSQCRKGFHTKAATEMHIRDKHEGAGFANKVQRRQVDHDDESMADRAVQAQLDKAMGIYNFDQEWLI